jgi:uncharacterized protein YndB with AHSA1/START domain
MVQTEAPHRPLTAPAAAPGKKRRAMTWLWIVLGGVAALALLLAILGATRSARHVAIVRADLAGPPEAVFAVISSHADQASWRSDVKSIELLAPQDGRTVFREVGGFGPVTFIVDESVAPRRYVVRILDEHLPYSGTWTWELEPHGRGTRVTITEAGEVKAFVFRALSVFFSKTATIETYLKSLGRKLGETVTPVVVRKN